MGCSYICVSLCGVCLPLCVSATVYKGIHGHAHTSAVYAHIGTPYPSAFSAARRGGVLEKPWYVEGGKGYDLHNRLHHKIMSCARVAQSVERKALNLVVMGSTPHLRRLQCIILIPIFSGAETFILERMDLGFPKNTPE
jgi:hypothetical protein